MEASSGFQTDWNMNPTICRLCLHSDGFLLGIFNHLHGKDKNIYKKIIDCTALEISSGDGLPHTICHRCLFKLELCLDFRAQCFVSDSTLRQASRMAHAHQRSANPNDRTGQHAQALSLRDLVPPQPGDSGDVVVVVDPSAVDYDSDYDSKYGRSESNEQYHDQPSSMAANIGHYGHHPMMMNHSTNDVHDSQIPSDNETNEIADNGGDIYDFRNVFMCRYCDRAFTDKQQCTRHETEEHDPTEPYSCKTCQLSFPDRLHYSAHLKSLHADDKPYDCPECEKMFARRSDLRKHTIVHTGIKPFTCPVCSKSFSRNTNLSKHMRIHAGHKPFVCPRCPKTFITRGDLQRHALIHSGRKPFPCRFCNLSFSRRDKLLRHEKRHFPAATSMVNVSGREKVRRGAKNGDYSGENMVIDIDPMYTGGHETSATIDNTVNLDNRPNSLDEHRQFDNTAQSVNDTTHDSNDEQNSLFSKRDLDNSGREIYEKAHKKRKPPKNLLSHVTGDENEPEEEKEEEIVRELTPLEKASKSKRYPCLQCHRRFSNMEGLKFHIQQYHNTSVNISGRPYSCSQCPKGFIRKRELDRHMTTHSGMKPFSCTSCDKKFGRKDKLVRHMRIHDGSNLHVCPVCTLAFSRKDSLWQHMRNHHRQDQLQYRASHHKSSELFNDSSSNITTPVDSRSIEPQSKTPIAKSVSVLRDYLEEETLSSSSNFDKPVTVTADIDSTDKRSEDAADLDPDFVDTKIELDEANLNEVGTQKHSPDDFEDSLMTDDKDDKIGSKEQDKERSSEFDEDDEEDEDYDEDRPTETENSRTNAGEIDDDLNEDKELLDEKQQDENSNLEIQNEQPNSGDPDYDDDLDLDENDDDNDDDDDEDGGQQLDQDGGQPRNKDDIIDCDAINDSADEEDSSQYGGQDGRQDGDEQQQQQQREQVTNQQPQSEFVPGDDLDDDYDDDNDEDDEDDDVQMITVPRSIIF